jgi:CubicO group peptidase (beta-lactamase class C family)
MTELTNDPGVREGLDALTAWLEWQIAFGGTAGTPPGVSIGIVHDQQLVWARGFGLADAEKRIPATPETLYRVASISKLFTVTAVMQLRDAGKLRLDDPVTAYLPWFSVKSEHVAAPAITVRHLITHTSGLPREAAYPYWMDATFPDWDQIKSKLPLQNQILATETRWKYSNLALALAGEVVATLSGQAWSDYVKANILDPLGMTATLATTPAPDHPGLAAGYARCLPGQPRKRAPWSDLKAIAPAAGITTSVSDLAKFAMLQFRTAGAAGGAQILKASTLREMQRVQWIDDGWEQGWGLGFSIYRFKGKTYVGHGGSLRGYRTDLRMSMADRIAVISFTNADDGDPASYHEKVFDWVVPAILKAVAPAKPVADPAWQRYLGRYRNPFADFEIVINEGRLTMLVPLLPDPLWAPSRLIPVAEHTFRVDTANGYGIPGETVRFELDGNGRVQRVHLGETYADPVDHW